MMTAEKREDVTPLCPHCRKNLTRVWYRELEPDLGKRLIYFCPECRCCLGVSHRKGITFGL